jgi:uncharacterized protein
MSTLIDKQAPAWSVTPQAYAAARPVDYTVPRPVSRYLTMRDGCRLAIDVYVPEPIAGRPAAGGRHPAIVLFTP